MKRILSKFISIFCAVIIVLQVVESMEIEAAVFNQSREVDQSVNKTTDQFGQFRFIMKNGLIYNVYNDDEIQLENSYDEYGFRVAKNGEDNCTFEYVDTMLMKETRNGNSIDYVYEQDDTYDYKNLVGFIYNGVAYRYDRDEQLRIIGIKDTDNNLVAEYVYAQNSNCVEKVLCNVDGCLVENTSQDLIGNINRIRNINAYWDIETNWYYENGVFYSAEENKIIGKSHHSEELTKSDYVSSRVAALRYNYDLDAEITDWQESLLNDDTFNLSVNLSETPWYDHLSEVETVARIIYGENTSSISDQKCVAWVIRNRCVDWGMEPKEVVTQNNQFSPADPYDICYNAVKTQNSNDPYWRNAVYMACLICTTTSESSWNSINLPPSGMSYQKYFRGTSARDNFDGDGDCIYYGSDELCDVYVPNYGSVDTYDELLYAFECCPNVNVFFSYY